MVSGKEDPRSEDEDVCPHCGAVLDVARAVEADRPLLSRPRKGASLDGAGEGPAA